MDDTSLIYTFPGKVPTGPGKVMNWYGFKMLHDDRDKAQLALFSIKEDGTTGDVPVHFVLTDLNSLDRMVDHLIKVRPIYVERLKKVGLLPEEESRRITVA